MPGRSAMVQRTTTPLATVIHIDPVYKKNGKVYFYFRRGGKRKPLPGAYNSPEFLEAYSALRNSAFKPDEIGAERTKPGTVNAAIVLYYKHPSFTKNKPISQQTDRNILEAFRAKHGDKRIALLQEVHIEAMLGEKAGKPSAQRNLLRVLRSLLKVAVKAKLRRDNPALGIELDRLETTGYHSWTEEELRQYEAFYPIGSKARLALHLLLYTTARRADVVALGPANMRQGRLLFTYSKNKTEMNIPVAEPLAATIAATPMIGVKTFLVTEYGKPFTPAGFGNWFRDRCNDAGLPQCTAHGLRKAFLRRMAEAGCSEDYIASISGHRDMREIRKYVQAANRARMATDGMARTLAMFPVKSGQ
jgi:integrase